MHLADHIRPLLRNHDCVIIPDFGGLVADASPARAQPGRQVLSPPTKLVAFNQALTRNDGLLVDALSQHTGLPIAQAREVVRQAVANLQQELDDTNRTELPGIGIFRRAAGRGLAFEYTGTDNLLASAFGLPELAARPVRAGEARLKHPQPVLRGAVGRRSRWARLVPAGLITATACLLVLVNLQLGQHLGYLPASWQAHLPVLGRATRSQPAATAEPQLATLGQHSFDSSPLPSDGITPLPDAVSEAKPQETLEAGPVTSSSASAELSVAGRSPAAGKPGSATAPLGTPAVPAAPAATAPAAKAPAPVAGPGATSGAAAAAAKGTGAASSTTIKSRTGRFYVIAGAYSSLARAEEGRRNLVHAGHPARIILPFWGSRLFRLAAADYPDKLSAEREARRLRMSTHCDYITLKY